MRHEEWRPGGRVPHLGEGVVDLAGLLLAAAPLGYGLVCWLRAPPSA
ncbi:hypothetical protein [Archangium lansingense]|uniref:Uncharacterized protein n=1 Tax=Archangium lansingense TaxID=2995310 RepID=A0ABT4AD45_9BACT|nr:hypothetical protein [Archangium lansinium]MCY1078834.1 hypothetical protein [Archangium lansinium]